MDGVLDVMVEFFTHGVGKSAIVDYGLECACGVGGVYEGHFLYEWAVCLLVVGQLHRIQVNHINSLYYRDSGHDARGKLCLLYYPALWRRGGTSEGSTTLDMVERFWGRLLAPHADDPSPFPCLSSLCTMSS